VTTFDDRVAAALAHEARQFSRGEVTLLAAHELATHDPNITGLLITYWRVLAASKTYGGGEMTETRYAIYHDQSDAPQHASTSGVLHTTWKS